MSWGGWGRACGIKGQGRGEKGMGEEGRGEEIRGKGLD